MVRTTGRRSWIWAIGLTLALSLAACGGEDAGDSAEAPATSDAEPTADSAADPDTATEPVAGTEPDAGAEDEEDSPPAAGSSEEVVLGAVWPQSGPFEFQGSASLAGFEAAIEDVNAEGGIGALGGAQLTVSSVDAGSSPEDAASAAERVLQDDPSAVVGSWLSSFTLASTEVTERAGVPQVTEAFADEATERGFQYTFAIVPRSTEQDDLMLDGSLPSLEAQGIDVSRVALVGDNSAAATPLQEALAAQFEERGIEVVVREQWSIPLDDPAGIASSIASGEPDVVFMIGYSFTDVSRLTNELRGRGVEVPIIMSGSQALFPQWRDFGDVTLGLTTLVSTHVLEQSQEAAADLAERIGVPYVLQDHLNGYFAGRLIAQALENAGSAEPDAVNEALHAMSSSEDHLVSLIPQDVVEFSENGRMTPDAAVLVQWQEDGDTLTPCTIWPEEVATCEPVWTR